MACSVKAALEVVQEEQKMQRAGKPSTFWHDVPLFPQGKDGQPMKEQVYFVSGETLEGADFNYGCLPQTRDTVCPDAGDALDACEIGSRIYEAGEVRKTKILGVISMTNGNQADRKLIVIDEEDELAAELDDVDDVERLLPGLLDDIREYWRTDFFEPDEVAGDTDASTSMFACDSVFMPRSFAIDAIVKCHLLWKKAAPATRAPSKEAPVERSLKHDSLSKKLERAALNSLIGG